MKYLHTFASVVLLLVLCMSNGLAVAQNQNPSNLSASPYNRYGYGRLGSLGNSVTRSMGDVGTAVRSNMFTNLANPASLTAIDTLTMIFTTDLDAQFAAYSESGSTDRNWNAGFRGMSFQAPLWRNFAMSLSLSPYSMVGYSYGSREQKPIQSPTTPHDTLVFQNTHSGVGGINNFMLGIGWRLFRSKKQELSLGAQAGWLFGTIQHSGTLLTSTQSNGTYLVYDMDVRGLLLRFGAQYTYNIDASQSLTLGATFAPRLNMHIGTNSMKYSTDTIQTVDKFHHGIQQPMLYSVGLAYNIQRKLILTAEFEQCLWSKVAGLDTDLQPKEGIFNDTYRMACGVEYLPKIATNNFFKACRYRAGVSYRTDYIKVNGKQLSEFNATLGMSMPVNKRCAIDFGVGYADMKPEGNAMVGEKYLTFNLGLTFNEMMFFRNMLR